jgi:hypothetical protein
MNLIIRGITFLFLCVFSLTLSAQSGRRVEKTVEKRQAMLDKQDEVNKEKAANELEEKKRRQFELQTKAVQKRIKRTRKKSKKYNDNKNEFFLKRWFRKR